MKKSNKDIYLLKEVNCHFKKNKMSIIQVFVNDSLYTVRKQTLKKTSDSFEFTLYALDKKIKLSFSNKFKWELISIDEIKK